MMKKTVLIALSIVLLVGLGSRMHRIWTKLDEPLIVMHIDRRNEIPNNKYDEPIYIYFTYEDILKSLEVDNGSLRFHLLSNQNEVMKFIEYMKENDHILTGTGGKYSGAYFVSVNSTHNDLINTFQLNSPPSERQANK